MTPFSAVPCRAPLIAIVALALAAPACAPERGLPGEPGDTAPPGTRAGASSDAPLSFIQITAGGLHSCGLTADGRA